MDLAYPDSHDLNFSNRPVRTRMPGGVAGVQPKKKWLPPMPIIGLPRLLSHRQAGNPLQTNPRIDNNLNKLDLHQEVFP